LRFEVYRDGKPAEGANLAGAYVFGQSSVPVRAELAFENGAITVAKRIPGAAGLTLLWNTGQTGTYLLPTTRLSDRVKPYNLNVELARARIMRIAHKQEEWGLFDYKDAKELNEQFKTVRKEFIEALKAPDPGKAAEAADKALADAITLSEKLALFHADIFLARRRVSSLSVARTSFGCAVDLSVSDDQYRKALAEGFDFVSVPVPWKRVEPNEGQYQYNEVDAWMNWAGQARKPVHAGPLLTFDQSHLPEWLYIWEHDYDSLREMILEHVRRIVGRYVKYVRAWNVVSGIHAQNSFNLSFEQLMELTRMTCMLVKQLAPRSQVMIDLALPWGEYYAHNQRTIPPLLYADMASQSGIKFDSFGMGVLMGAAVEGHYARDLMQISAMLDEFMKFSKNVHVTACQVPSAATPDESDKWSGQASVEDAGQWHAPWSQRLQAEWLQAFYRIAISKPYVDTICWRDLGDRNAHYLPHGGLFAADMKPKLAYRELRNFKAYLLSAGAEVIDQQRRKADQQ